MNSNKKIDYTNKVILAPMVRVCTLPMRLLALQYGADLVYCEEIIDHKILSAKRIENDLLGTVDFVLSDGTIVFRTCPRLERGKLIFQLGTCDAKRALMAAKKVEKDVDGIDINMGCPKEFSVKGGMGAALLTQPEKVKEILTTLVNGLSIPVTCKIRVLPQLEATLSLVKLIESTGVSALTVHGRTKEERPRHANRNHVIKAVTETVKVPIIANGGSREIKQYSDIKTFRQQCGSSSVMLARAAEWNPSVFRKEGKLPLFDVIKEYVKLCIEYDSNFSNVKYCVLQMMHEDMDQQEGLDTQASATLEEICNIWGLLELYNEVVGERMKKLKEKETLAGLQDIRVRQDDGDIETLIIRLPVRYLRKNYSVAVSPKQFLYEWTKRVKIAGKPVYITTEDEDRCYNSVLKLNKTKFTTPYWEKSKQIAEQGAAICASVVIGFSEGRHSDIEEYEDICKRWKQFMDENNNIDFRWIEKLKRFGEQNSNDFSNLKRKCDVNEESYSIVKDTTKRKHNLNEKNSEQNENGLLQNTKCDNNT